MNAYNFIQLAADIAYAIYGRLSDNDGKRSDSTKNQISIGQRHLERRGVDLSKVPTFADDDYSASEFRTKTRPHFEALLEIIRAGLVQCVVVTEISRFCRDPEEAYLRLRPLVRTTPWQWIETTDGEVYDLTTKEGRDAFMEEVWKASKESGTISRRILRRNTIAASQGRYHGGGRPRYGYEEPTYDEFGRVTNTGRNGIVPIEHKFAIMREWLRWLRAGKSFYYMRDQLNDRGEPNPSGIVRGTIVKGKPHPGWRPSAIRQIIVNEAYAAFDGDDLSHGTRVYNGERHKAVWPAVYTRSEWEEIQLIITAQERMKGADKKGVRSYLLTGGIGKCGLDGSDMVARRKSASNGGHRRYVCGAEDSDKHGLGGLCRMAEPVELMVIDYALNVYSDPDFAEKLRRAYQAETTHDRLSMLLDEAQAHRLKLDELEQAWKQDQLPLAKMLKLQASVQKALDEVTAKLERISVGRLVSGIITGSGIYEAFDGMGIHQQRMAVGLVVKEVFFYPGQTGAHVWVHERTGKTFRFDPTSVKIVPKF